MFLFAILEALFAYMTMFKLEYLKENETILNRNANDKSRGNQLTRPGCLQRVLRVS